MFPIDTEARIKALSDIPLKWVETFKYLEVVVSRQASEFILEFDSDPRRYWVKVKNVEVSTIVLIGT